MKKILAVVIALSSVSAFAQHHGHHGHYHGHRGPGWGWWVAPVITGVIGYEIARSQQPVVVQQQPVIVQQPQVVYQSNPNCGPWIETQNADGTITRTRTCNQ